VAFHEARAVVNEGQMCGGPRTDSQAVKLLESQSVIDFAVEGIIGGGRKSGSVRGRARSYTRVLLEKKQMGEQHPAKDAGGVQSWRTITTVMALFPWDGFC